jgi:hypothetical protein
MCALHRASDLGIVYELAYTVETVCELANFECRSGSLKTVARDSSKYKKDVVGV